MNVKDGFHEETFTDAKLKREGERIQVRDFQELSYRNTKIVSLEEGFL